MYVEEPRDDSYRHKSDYRSVPVEWLGQQFLDDAEHLKKTNPRAYQHEYLGLPVGLGTNIFELLEIRTIPDEEIQKYQSVYQGQDWGWYPDPKAFIRVAYVPNQDKVILLDELGGCKIRNTAMANQIKKKDMMIIQYLAELMKKKVLLTSEMQGFQHVGLLSHREAANILLSGYSAEH